MNSLPNYRDLDLSGEAQAAAQRMEARALEPTSEDLFQALVAPLIGPGVRAILEVGCGTGALARRVAARAPGARVLATDKSAGMLAVAERLAAEAAAPGLSFRLWDVLDEAAFPDRAATFDLILSSVMMVYLDEAQAEDLVRRLARRLKPGGVLAFVEQDHLSDAVGEPTGLLLKLLDKDRRTFKRTQALGLRSSFRRAGLEPLPRRSFLWTDDRYGAYTRDLLERFADAARAQGRITAEECARVKEDLDTQAKAGDFYYGIVYHRVAASAPGA